jgi:NADPH:quinone reductase-like Zn-dependent oxidoreductase
MTSNSSPGTALVKVGGWSSHLVLDAADLVPVPDGVRAVDAETVVVNGITAWQMLHRRQSPVLELLGRLWLWSLLPNRRHAYFYNVWAGRALGRDAFRARLRTDLTAVLAAMAAGKLTAQVAAELPLTSASEALRLAESRTVAGKVVLSAVA